MKKEKMIQKYLAYLHEKDDVFEVSAILRKPTVSPLWGNVEAKQIVTGYFKDHKKAAQLILKLDEDVKPEAVYVSLNPCQKSLLARANHKLKANLKRTKDVDVQNIRNLIIDVDPVRKSGTSSTDSEHKVALSIARSVKWDLDSRGWLNPLLGDSGNGAHLIYKVSLNNTKDNVQRLQQSLKALARKYDTDQVKIDTGVFNPGRLVKVYGTRTRKGKRTDDRPHRVAKTLSIPQDPGVVSKKKLNILAATFKSEKESKADTQGPNGEQQRKLDLQKYLDHYGVKVLGTKRHGNSTMYCLEKCLFNEKHKPNEAAIGQADKGLLYYQCFHNSCKKFQWIDARHKISGDDKLSDFWLGASLKEAEMRPRIEIVSAAHIVAHKVEGKPLIRGLLGQRETSLLYGPSGIGKTLLSVNLALHLAIPSANNGLLWGQFQIPEPVKTLFIQSENGLYSTHKRLSLICKVRPEFKKAMKKLYFPKLGADCRLMGDLQDKAFQNLLQELIFSTGAGLLVLDPLISYHFNNENDNAEMRKALDALTRLCEDTNAAVLVVHHAGKAGTSGGARGASAITDWAANVVSLEPVQQGEGSENESLKVHCDKSRNFERFPEFHLQLSSNLFFERVQGFDAKSDKNEAVVSALTALGGNVDKQGVLVDALVKHGYSASKAQKMIKIAAKDGLISYLPGKGKTKGIALVKPIIETSDLDEEPSD
jgi:hypothetical protein